MGSPAGPGWDFGLMATITQVSRTCDMCGDGKDVQTWTFGVDGETYQIDLCPKDGKDLSEIKARYIPKARKVTVRKSRRRGGRQPRSRAATAASSDGANASGTKTSGRGGSTQGGAKAAGSPQRGAKASDASARGTGPHSGREGRVGRSEAAASNRAASDTGADQEGGIFVYGILPADIDVAPEMSGMGGRPLRVVRSGDLAALVSELDGSGRPGSPDDLRTHREILDAAAAEVPILPVHFGTVLASEDVVAEELLTADRDEFAAALEQLDGHAEFIVRGRYVEGTILDELSSEIKQAARLRDTIRRKDSDAIRDARAELDVILDEGVAAWRKEDTQALQKAMEGISVASIVREPADELDAVHVAFLVAVDDESEMERVIDDLARDWAGWIDVELLGPVAAYDFVGNVQPEADTNRAHQAE